MCRSFLGTVQHRPRIANTVTSELVSGLRDDVRAFRTADRTVHDDKASD